MKKIINSIAAPTPIGPYSQAVQFGNMLFLSGQIAINPVDGSLIQESIQAETHQIMRNIQAVLKEANADLSQVLKSSIFLKSMDDFQVVNEVYAAYFVSDYPARETVAVRTLPKDVNVEISVIVGLDS